MTTDLTLSVTQNIERYAARHGLAHP